MLAINKIGLSIQTAVYLIMELNQFFRKRILKEPEGLS